MNDDPFSSDFFQEAEEKHKEHVKENSVIRRVFGFGLLATVVVLVLNLVIYGAIVAVVLWVALTVLKHFGVLTIVLGAIA